MCENYTFYEYRFNVNANFNDTIQSFFTKLFEPFRFWRRIREYILNRKSTPPLTRLATRDLTELDLCPLYGGKRGVVPILHSSWNQDRGAGLGIPSKRSLSLDFSFSLRLRHRSWEYHSAHTFSPDERTKFSSLHLLQNPI